MSNLSFFAGDICRYWNKTVIIHRVGPDPDWAEVIKLKNPNIPAEPSGKPFTVRLSHLNLVHRAVS